MKTTLSIEEARTQLSRVAHELEESAEPQAVQVTRYGKPVLALLPWEFYDALIETLEIMGDPELWKELQESIQDVHQGRVAEWKGWDTTDALPRARDRDGGTATPTDH